MTYQNKDLEVPTGGKYVERPPSFNESYPGRSGSQSYPLQPMNQPQPAPVQGSGPPLQNNQPPPGNQGYGQPSYPPSAAQGYQPPPGQGYGQPSYPPLAAQNYQPPPGQVYGQHQYGQSYQQPPINQGYLQPSYPPPAQNYQHQSPNPISSQSANNPPVVVLNTGQQQQQQQQQGNCPMCQKGYMVEEFSCCGILCAIFCFPCGLICLFCMKPRRCVTCGFSHSRCCG